jgi:cytochrome b561
LVSLSQNRYSTLAIALHWVIAAFIVLNLYLGLQMAGLSSEPGGGARVDLIHIGALRVGWSVKGFAALLRFQTFQLHKSIGFTILALSLIRLGWRLLGPRRPPKFSIGLARWERFAATAVHWGFYVIMIGLPLTGWVIVSASPTNIPTLLFKKIPIPHLGFVHTLALPVRKLIEDQVGDLHSWLAWTTFALLFLHVGAALKHLFVNRDDVVYRMVPIQILRPR